MRVAMLGLYPRDRSNIIGGVEAVTAALVDHLSNQDGLELHMLTCRADLTHAASSLIHPPSTILHELPLRRYGRFTFHRATVADLQQTLAHLQPDVVHAHGTGFFAGAAITSPFPSVITVHGVMAGEARTVWGWRRRLARQADAWYERWVLKRAREIISISPYLLQVYPGLQHARVHEVENPVDERYFGVQPQPHIGRLLCVARVIPRKRILELIEAFALLADRWTEAQLRIAGESGLFPEYDAACRAAIAWHGLQHRIHLLGALPPQQIQAEYAACAVHILASSQETASISIEEAMAAARPVIATDVGGNRYLVEQGVSGWLVPLGDSSALVASIEEALAHPDRAEQMGQAARKQALARFHPRALAEKTRALYENVVQYSIMRNP